MFPVPGKTEKTAGFLLPDVFFWTSGNLMPNNNRSARCSFLMGISSARFLGLRLTLRLAISGGFWRNFPGHAADHDWMVKKLEKIFHIGYPLDGHHWPSHSGENDGGPVFF